MIARSLSTLRGLGALLLLAAVLLVAIGTAFAQDPTPPDANGAADAAPPATAAPDAATAPMPTPSSGPNNGSWVTNAPLTSGLAPVPDNGAVPTADLPPGSFDQDTGPSEAIFPPQTITLRFNHKYHVTTQKMQCSACHKNAATSESIADRLTPAATTCDTCHGTDHSNLDAVKLGDGESGKCNFCHVGYTQGDGNKLAKLDIPRPNMIFNHKKHVSRNINCQQCHGDVQNLELATRDQMPRMRGCFGCHQKTDAAAQGEAKSSCETCHLKATSGLGGGEKVGGRIKTSFASGTMEPPRWLHNAGHGPDFVQRHKYVAANDSQFCSNCHKEDYCTNCHDGRTKPRNIHPNDYLNMHATEARLATQKCQSCHREQSFCIQCHQRLGISMSGPASVKAAGRFHPPKSEWSDPPRKPGHHSFEAMRNLNACVSCHIERDCVVCHGGQGIGAGFNPHGSNFIGSCASQFKRNPRPCYVCHEPGSQDLTRCR